jgi:hypothetical protein
MPSIRSTARQMPELVAEGRQPVVPVGQHHQLPVVADLEQLLGAAVQEADDRLGGGDPAVLHGERHLQHPVRGGVVRPERQQGRPGRRGGGPTATSRSVGDELT